MSGTAVWGAFGRKTIPRIVFRTSLTASERHISHPNPLTQGHDHCPAGDCKAICREGDSDHKFNIAPNLSDRDFIADQPNQKWAGDISYIWTREGWLYLAVILDLHSRRVIGWAVSNCMKRDLAIRALQMAIAFRSPPKGCIHHTDRDSRYCSHDYQKILRQHDFKVSMSGKGNCYDNAAVETFFKTIKAELIWRHPWETRRQAEMAIFEYINGFYNPRHRHSALGWKSPVAFERKVA